MGIALNMEVGNPRKLAGISLAVVGAICMVAGGASSASHAKGVTSEQASHMLVGDVCLLINTFAMAVYYIVSKQMVQRYPAICVAAWAYLVAATCMGLAAAAFTTPADWHFPRAMVGPLIYWIIVCSVAGYYAVTWAMRHLPASQVRFSEWSVFKHVARRGH
jgi:drug/metabolite transporter (DMT)-like permease